MSALPTGGRILRKERYHLVRRASPLSKIRAMARWLALIAITQQVSCSGGKGAGSTNTNADPFAGVTVSVSPGSSQVSAGGSVQFIATVQNASNPVVSWQVNGIPSGNSSVGTIAPAGAGTATYMAPASVSSALTVTVSPVLQADTTKSGSATVIIDPPSNAQVTVSPSNPDIVAGESLQFSANVQNGPQAVIWDVDGIQMGNSTVGLINSAGFYTAPATIPNPPTVTITAILQTDSSVSGSTKATIVAPVPSVSISPSTANVITGQTLQFSASVQNSSAGVIWEVNSVPGGTSTVGTIVSSGSGLAMYTAPATIPPEPNPFTVTVTAVLQSNPPISSSAGVTILLANTFTGVYSWRNDNGLTGQNPQETTLTPSNVAGGHFGKQFGCAVDGSIFAQPLYVANVTIGGTLHNVVYVATENDTVYAFDADHLCQTVWQVSFIDPAAGVTAVPAGDIGSQQDIIPKIGITGTPVIDPSTATLYVVGKTKENGTYVQRLHALDLTTGQEKFGGPTQVPPIGIASLTENQRSALLLVGGNVYIAFDSYSDTDPFHGWLFACNAGDLQTGPGVFDSTPNGSRGGMGESGAAPSSDASGNVFVVTSDGTFDANTGGSDYAETLLKLQVNTGFAIANPSTDTFTPFDQTTLNLTHEYFGSTGVLLLPDAAGSSTHPHLAAAGNEAGSLYLLDRDKLGGFTSGGPDQVVQTLSFSGSIFGTPSYWAANNSVYVAAAGDNLRVLPLTTGTLNSPSCSTSPSSCSADTFPFFGASPVISSNGSSNGILWALDTSGYVNSAPAILRAYDATNLTTRLYESPSSGSGAAGSAVKFAVPTVANGRVYVGTQGELSVFGLLP